MVGHDDIGQPAVFAAPQTLAQSTHVCTKTSQAMSPVSLTETSPFLPPFICLRYNNSSA